jgi:hypothetical protein
LFFLAGFDIQGAAVGFLLFIGRFEVACVDRFTLVSWPFVPHSLQERERERERAAHLLRVHPKVLDPSLHLGTWG